MSKQNSIEPSGCAAPSLPPGWHSVSLGDLLTDIEAGKSFRCDPSVPSQNQIGIVKVSAVTWGEYQEDESKTCDDPTKVSPQLFVKPGDFLFSRANTIALVGACVIARQVTKRVMLSDKILRLHFAAPVQKWALYFLRSLRGRAEIEKFSTGNQDSMRNIGQVRIRQIGLPFAPLPEQRRIVAEIEKQFTRLDASIANLERVKANLKRARASVLKAAVEGRLVPTEAALARAEGRDYEPASVLLERILEERKRKHEETNGKKKYKPPVEPETDGLPELPEGWAWAGANQAFVWSSGDFLPGDAQQGGPVPVYGGNGVNGFHNESLVEQPVLIVGRVGAHCGNIHVSAGPSWITDNAIYAKVAPECLSLPYWSLALGQENLNANAAGTGQPYVNQRLLNSLIVPLPPDAEQRQIVQEVERRVSVLDATDELVEVNLARCNRLRQSILKRAFEGKLVPQDPNDEPANELLARILAEAEAAKPKRTKKKAAKKKSTRRKTTA